MFYPSIELRLYLYAITDHPEIPVPTARVVKNEDENEARPYKLVFGDIAAVVSSLSTNEISPTEANLWRHEGVVESLMINHAVLPMRFGTVLADETAVYTVLESCYPNFTASLNRVRGRVELGLRVLWDDAKRRSIGAEVQRCHHNSPLRSIADSGRRYLLNRLEAERQRQIWQRKMEDLAEEVHAPLSQLAAESTLQVSVTPRMPLTAAYLVERDSMVGFQKEVDTLSTAHPLLHFLCTGPWPPYNFVTETVSGSME